MSEDYRIIALGREDFAVPYGMAGLDFKIFEKQNDAVKYMQSRDLTKSVFILDENIVENVKVIEDLEESGGNVLILKPWGKSGMAKDKIRNASIKAIGTDMSLKE